MNADRFMVHHVLLQYNLNCIQYNNVYQDIDWRSYGQNGEKPVYGYAFALLRGVFKVTMKQHFDSIDSLIRRRDHLKV